MSFRASPIGPTPAGRTSIVDGGSLAPDEDGTWRAPYKTIQAALDARPRSIDSVIGQTPWVLNIVPGWYDEDLTIPASGHIWLIPLGFVGIGFPSGILGNITYDAVPGFVGAPPEGSALFIGQGGKVQINGDFTITSPTGHTVKVVLANVDMLGSLDATGVVDSLALEIDLTYTQHAGGVDAPTADTCLVGLGVIDGVCDFGQLKAQHYSFGDDVTAGTVTELVNNTFEGAFTDNTANPGITYRGNVFNGLTTIANPGGAVGSTFADVFVGAVPTIGFQASLFTGSFEGPAASFLVDESTSAVSAGVSFVPPATKLLLSDPSAPAASLAIRTISTTPEAILLTDAVVLVDATGGNIILNLPTAIGNTGVNFYFKKIDITANTVTVTPFGGQTIDGFATEVMDFANQSIQLVSNNVAWFIIG